MHGDHRYKKPGMLACDWCTLYLKLYLLCVYIATHEKEAVKNVEMKITEVPTWLLCVQFK